MRLSCKFVVASFLTAILAIAPAKLLPAQDAAAAAKSAAAAKEAAAKLSDKEVLKQWADLQAKRDSLEKSVTQLEKDFQAANDAKKKEIAVSFEKMMTDFQTNVAPQLHALAPRVLKADPKNLKAAEAVMGPAFQENQFDKAVAIVDAILASGQSSAMILNIGGISHFALHHFEKAQDLLSKAKATDKQLFPQLGAPFLEAAPEYIGFWKKEQAIRAKEATADDLPRVLLKTTKGDIVLELFENEAPNTVANFISLVEKKTYDGVKFHRVIPDFMAQGGDVGEIGYNIACECYVPNARKHFQGSLSMAHAGKDTGSSQFFLTHLPTPHLNVADGKTQSNHTVFGRIIKGMDVALALRAGDGAGSDGDKIITATVLRKRDHDYVPKKLGGK